MSEIRCRVVDRNSWEIIFPREPGIGITSTYACEDEEVSSGVDINWLIRPPDPHTGEVRCYLSYIHVYPKSTQRRGFGTQALYEWMDEAVKECDTLEGASLDQAVGFWEKMIPLITDQYGVKSGALRLDRRKKGSR